ncbi:hypothetical protein EI77_04641 [Prosthecobacter fusiformis]|uniref:Uncharacterized protein n=1 Tax=Prosthecobacter fusiformis TaxID=48464 RepID=A0A4R7RJC2_9BACT|nr:hypothetical protein EI77_04641 [Prosthecobacter fusiformis]
MGTQFPFPRPPCHLVPGKRTTRPAVKGADQTARGHSGLELHAHAGHHAVMVLIGETILVDQEGLIT